MTLKVLCKGEQNVLRAVPSKNEALADFLVEDREAQSRRGWAEAADWGAGEGQGDDPSSLGMTALPFSLPILEGSVLSPVGSCVFGLLPCLLIHFFIQSSLLCAGKCQHVEARSDNKKKEKR